MYVSHCLCLCMYQSVCLSVSLSAYCISSGYRRSQYSKLVLTNHILIIFCRKNQCNAGDGYDNKINTLPMAYCNITVTTVISSSLYLIYRLSKIPVFLTLRDPERQKVKFIVYKRSYQKYLKSLYREGKLSGTTCQKRSNGQPLSSNLRKVFSKSYTDNLVAGQ